MTTTPGATPTADELADAVERHGGRIEVVDGLPRWWITDPSSAAEDTAAHLGLTEHRRLLQMRRALPLDAPIDESTPPPPTLATPPMATRPFDPDHDVDAWLAINNAAFDWHPEQGGWTRDTLEARMAEPWFDLDDFRIADLDGAMVGFCWTKVHHEPTEAVGIPRSEAEEGRGTRPNLSEATEVIGIGIGEIYVIAVAPDRVGTGLGTALTIAGLDSLWTRHRTPIGMLYVESDNERALATYRRLGFEVHSADVAFEPETT